MLKWRSCEDHPEDRPRRAPGLRVARPARPARAGALLARAGAEGPRPGGQRVRGARAPVRRRSRPPPHAGHRRRGPPEPERALAGGRAAGGRRPRRAQDVHRGPPRDLCRDHRRRPHPLQGRSPGAPRRPLRGARRRLVELLTVGHSTHPLDAFLALIEGAGVETIADVRRFPGSRRHPHFGAEALAGSLRDAGIGYEHLAELGGRRSVEPGSPNDGWEIPAFRAYADHLRSPEFAAGRSRLAELARERRVAVMCAEAQHWRCHRRLIADVFTFDGWHVRHLMSSSRIDDHAPPPFAIRAPDGLPLYPAPGQEPLFGGY